MGFRDITGLLTQGNFAWKPSKHIESSSKTCHGHPDNMSFGQIAMLLQVSHPVVLNLGRALGVRHAKHLVSVFFEASKSTKALKSESFQDLLAFSHFLARAQNNSLLLFQRHNVSGSLWPGVLCLSLDSFRSATVQNSAVCRCMTKQNKISDCRRSGACHQDSRSLVDL